MSAILFRFTVPAILLVLAGPAQPAVAQPSIVSRTVVSMGGINSPVNETSVAAYGDKLVAMWNIMQWTGTDWAHYRLGYAVSEDGGESWSDMGFFPKPEGCSGVQFDPTVVADPFGEFAGDFTGGGIVWACTGASANRVHVARMPDGDTEFDASIDLSNAGSACPPDYTHLAAGPDPSDPEGSTHVYMTCFTTGGDISCSAFNIGLLRSVDAGQNWSSRSIVEVNNSPVGGAVATWPAVTSDGTLYIAYNDRSNQSAQKIEVLANASAGSGQFTNLSLDHARIPFSFPSRPLSYC